MSDFDYKTKIALIEERMQQCKKDIEEIGVKVEIKLVTRTEFEPIRKIVYGLVGIALTALLVALITTVMK